MRLSVDAIEMAKMVVEITDLKAENARLRELVTDFSMMELLDGDGKLDSCLSGDLHQYAESLIYKAKDLLRSIDFDREYNAEVGLA